MIDSGLKVIKHEDIGTLRNYRGRLELARLLKIYSTIGNVFNPILSAINKISNPNNASIISNITMTDIFGIIIEGADLYRFIKENNETRKIINESELNLLKYASILSDCNWTPFRDVQINHVNEIISVWEDSGSTKKVGSIIKTYYDKEKILSLYDKWSSKPFLKRRLHILNEAIKAHLEKDYYLSIPVMLSQLEGMVADIYNHKGEMHEPALNTYLKELIEVQKFESYNKLYDKLFSATIMASFQHGSPLISQLSRHAILHGASVKHGTEENSLKLILFFDLIQDCAKYCCYNKNRTFHLIGCAKIRKIDWAGQLIKKSDIANYLPEEYYTVSNKRKGDSYFRRSLRLYGSYDEAMQSKRPCKYCIDKK